jgi:hypothetical protein
MFDTEHVLGYLLLGELTKTAAVRYRGMGFGASPRQAPRFQWTPAAKELARQKIRERKAAKLERAQIAADKAKQAWATQRAQAMKGVTKRQEQEAARAADPAYQARIQAQSDRNDMARMTASNTTGGSLPPTAVMPTQGSSSLVDRNSAGYQDRLAKLYASQGLQAPTFSGHTEMAGNPGGAATTTDNVPGVAQPGAKAMGNAVSDANKDINATAKMDTAAERAPYPTGVTPKSKASGVGTYAKGPAGPTTTNANPQPTPTVAMTSPPPQMPPSGPSVSQGDTAKGPTAKQEVLST